MEREIRYTVLKHADLNRLLAPADQHALNRIESIVTASREAEGRGELKAVVVEHDWPEYEPVWDMIAKRVDAKDRKVINPITRNGPIPGGAFELARKMSEALSVDRLGDGFDLEAGLYGSELTQLLIEMDSWRKKAEMLEKIRGLMGFIEDGSYESVHLFQDDATRTYHVQVGATNSDWGNTFEEAVRNAVQKHGAR